jgi:hypothetical protein
MLRLRMRSGGANRPRKGPAVNNLPSQWDEYAERARKQLPAAPEPLLDGYVRYAPWIAIVFGVLGVIGSLVGGILTLGSPLFVLLLLNGVLDVVGGYWMLSRRLSGWWLLAIGLILGIISNLLGASILALIVTVFVAYVHLQVKPRYR